MEKYRIAFTVQDYYDYIGTNPYCSIKEKMLQSIPDEFRKVGYNIKFKKIYVKLNPYDRYYRVHMSLRISKERLNKVLERYKLKLNNVSYKIINSKWEKEKVI